MQMTEAESGAEVLAIDDIRRAFPALERRERGLPVAYFDGPGGTQVPRGVVDAVADYLLHHNANTHWAYPTSAETDDALAGARRAFADFLGAAPDEIAFGANMTTLTFHVARALGRGWRAGDEIVVTDLDHQANIAPWHDLARERGPGGAHGADDPRQRDARLGRLRIAGDRAHPAGRRRRGVERHRHDQRPAPRGRAGARRRGAGLRRRRAPGGARQGRLRGARLRPVRLLAVQVLRAPPRRPGGPPRAAREARRAAAAAGQQRGPGAPRDRHAVSRGHRRRRRRGRLPRLAGLRAPTGRHGCATPSPRCTDAARRCSPAPGTAWRRCPACASSGRRPESRASPTLAFVVEGTDLRGGRPAAWRSAPCSSPTATSTPPTWSPAWVFRRTGWSAPAAPSTRRPRRSTGWSRAFAT